MHVKKKHFVPGQLYFHLDKCKGGPESLLCQELHIAGKRPDKHWALRDFYYFKRMASQILISVGL